MKKALAALCLLLPMAGCATLPPERALDPGAVQVTVLDRDAASGIVRLALENRSREPLAYLWTYVSVSTTPRAGLRENPLDATGDQRAMAGAAVEIPLGAGRRQIISFPCTADGLCRDPDAHVGIHLCRPTGYCGEFEIVWSGNSLAEAGARAAP
ncbi:hypothetical protein [Arenimonas sp. MALMAid1274]|uniref:hypothetical protein n=1 Tax=Arenimonas sp. MALMAid1274 TaxID=3411630 RepID=UPI003BA06F5E